MAKRKSICILALSTIARDGRVLRQIEYLSPHYDLTVAGYGDPPAEWADHPHVRWAPLSQPIPAAQLLAALKNREWAKLGSRLAFAPGHLAFKLSTAIGKRVPQSYDWGYRLRWLSNRDLQRVLSTPHDAFHANDWNTIPFTARAARRHKARLVIDLHEYAPLEFEGRANWHLYEPMIRSILQKYDAQADASITVAPAIAERYRQEFDLDPIVVLNAPRSVPLPPKKLDPQNIRIIYHGSASAIRKPEILIEAIAQCDSRYSLHFMFIPSDYVQHLKKLAKEQAPGRVTFHDPVAPTEIVSRIAEFDVGTSFLPPHNFNDLMALPNKLFESIVAGLAICVGPSRSMAEIIETYGCGCVAPSFEPADIANMFNRTTATQWAAMQTAAREAAKQLNADHEMQKVVDLYQRLFNEI